MHVELQIALISRSAATRAHALRRIPSEDLREGLSTPLPDEYRYALEDELARRGEPVQATAVPVEAPEVSQRRSHSEANRGIRGR